LFALVPDDATAAPPTSIRAEMGRSLADGLGRALAAGDNREARRILAALSALTADDLPDAAPASGAPVVDLAVERERRGR